MILLSFVLWFGTYPKIEEELAFGVCAALPHTLQMRFFYGSAAAAERYGIFAIIGL